MNDYKQPKILIAAGIYPPDIGGPATMVKALAEALAMRGFKVRILAYGRATAGDNDGPVPVWRIRKTSLSGWNHIRYLTALLCWSVWSDLNYATDNYSAGYFCFMAKRLLRRKYIIRFAGDSAWETAVNNGWTNDDIIAFQKKIYGRRIERLKQRRRKILATADKVIAVSNFISSVARLIGVSDDRIKMIYNSVDFLANREPDPAIIAKIRAAFPPDARIIATACRLVPWKGVDGLIRTLPRLLAAEPRIHLLILGDGPQFSALRELAHELSVEKSVVFCGRISQNEIAAYYRASDLFILNTSYEGLSHALLEAMQAGTPIIASDIGGNREVIEDGVNGRLIRYNDENDIYEAAIALLADAEPARSYADQGRKKLAAFSWKKNIEETITLINGTINKT